LNDVRLASIHARDLPALAALRDRLDIRVVVDGDRAWISWNRGVPELSDLVYRFIMPISGAELYIEGERGICRLGESLPAFGLGAPDPRRASPLAGVVIPGPLTARRPAATAPERARLTVVPDGRGPARPATALRCRLAELFDWGQRSTSTRFVGLTAAWSIAPGAGAETAEVLVLGPQGRLPDVLHGTRFWGDDILVPLGFRTAPRLPAGLIRKAAGVRDDDLLVFGLGGVEAIDRALVQPLDRARLRLAQGIRADDHRPEGGAE
jgi:hypothetical protein